MEASINDAVSQKQSHQRVHLQLRDACETAPPAPGSQRRGLPRRFNVTSGWWEQPISATQCETAVMEGNKAHPDHAPVMSYGGGGLFRKNAVRQRRFSHRFHAFLHWNITAVSLVDATDGPMSAAPPPPAIICPHRQISLNNRKRTIIPDGVCCDRRL